MAKLIIVVGLPGSGKTTLLERLEWEGHIKFDDYKAGAYDDSPSFSKSRHYDHLLKLLQEQKRCVISDIDFCNENARAEAEQVLQAHQIQIDWRFFAKDPQACEVNIRRRNRESLKSDLQELQKYSAIYSIPPDATVLQVHRIPPPK